MKPYMCKWVGLKQGRHRASPHIKTFTRMSANPSARSEEMVADGGEADAVIAWHLMTSHNLSKAAWGVVEKTGCLFIRNYELGVLIMGRVFAEQSEPYPLLLTASKSNFHPTPPSAIYDQNIPSRGSNKIVPIQLPYDIPLSQYDWNNGDECWTWDLPRKEPDMFGNTWRCDMDE